MGEFTLTKVRSHLTARSTCAPVPNWHSPATRAIRRRTPLLVRGALRRGVIVLLLFGTGSGGARAMRPQELVRSAIK